MDKIILARQLLRKYNDMSLEECVTEFEEYTDQVVPIEAIVDFKFTGLNNVDFLTGDWLMQYGVKNLHQM